MEVSVPIKICATRFYSHHHLTNATLYFLLFKFMIYHVSTCQLPIPQHKSGKTNEVFIRIFKSYCNEKSFRLYNVRSTFDALLMSKFVS